MGNEKWNDPEKKRVQLVVSFKGINSWIHSLIPYLSHQLFLWTKADLDSVVILHEGSRSMALFFSQFCLVDVGRGAKILILAVKWGFPIKPP